jgi:SH3 domain protein
MSNRFLLRKMILLGASLAVSIAAQGQARWVSDQFEITLRSGPSSDNAIQLMINSGTELELLEVDAENGYSRVVTGGGTEGWVLSRYLIAEPPAREQVETLTQQLTSMDAAGESLAAQIGSIRGEHESALQRIAELERDNSALQGEVEDIRRASANALAIDSQNRSLQQQLTDAEIRVNLLEQEMGNLGSKSSRNWFVTGALVLFGGVLLGLVLPRMKWQRKSRYDRF